VGGGGAVFFGGAFDVFPDLVSDPDGSEGSLAGWRSWHGRLLVYVLQLIIWDLPCLAEFLYDENRRKPIAPQGFVQLECHTETRSRTKKRGTQMLTTIAAAALLSATALPAVTWRADGETLVGTLAISDPSNLRQWAGALLDATWNNTEDEVTGRFAHIPVTIRLN